MKLTFARLALFATAAIALSESAAAQSVNIGGGQIFANHELLGNSMRGVGGAVTLPTPIDRLDFQISYGRYNGTSARVGVVCSGLVLPGTCGSEPIHDESSLYLFSAGPSFNIIRAQGFTLNALAQLQSGGVSSDTYGLQSGRSLAASKMMWGTSAGVSAAWQPDVKRPIAFQGTAALGRLGKIRSDNVVDGYAPFEGNSFRTRTMTVSVVYLMRR